MTTSKNPSRTDVMVQAVMAAYDGRLEIGYHESEQYERLIRSARQFRKLPDGKELRLEQDWRESKAWVVMEDQPAWQRMTLEPIPVPEQLRKPSNVVSELRNRVDFRIRQAEKSRALRLIEALVGESRRRGYRAEATPAPRTDRWGYTDTDKEHGHIVITINGHAYRLTMSQEQDRVKHVPTKTEEARGWSPRYDQVMTDRLRLTIEGNTRAFRSSAWADKPSRQLENALAEVLQEVELRAEQAEQRRLEEIRQLEEQQRQWELARQGALGKLNEAHRAATLVQQLESWELAQRLKSYLAAIEEHLSAHPEQRQSAAEWLDWIRDYAERINPLSASLTMPPDPKPTPEALAPHMEPWNPYGPS